MIKSVKNFHDVENIFDENNDYGEHFLIMTNPIESMLDYV